MLQLWLMGKARKPPILAATLLCPDERHSLERTLSTKENEVTTDGLICAHPKCCSYSCLRQKPDERPGQHEMRLENALLHLAFIIQCRLLIETLNYRLNTKFSSRALQR